MKTFHAIVEKRLRIFRESIYKAAAKVQADGRDVQVARAQVGRAGEGCRGHLGGCLRCSKSQQPLEAAPRVGVGAQSSGMCRNAPRDD